MKTLIIGFMVFLGWAAVSTHLYVCNIRGLCDGYEVTPDAGAIMSDIVGTDTLSKPLSPVKSLLPGTLTIYFEFNKSEFSPDSMTARYVAVSKDYLTQNPQARLNITGHTDAVGTEIYNVALGYRRSESMLHYFEKMGLASGKIMIKSEGEKSPVDDNNTTKGRENNRRTIITLEK